MTDLLKQLTDSLNKEKAEQVRINGLSFDCKVRIKAIEKAIKALTPSEPEKKE